MPGPVDDDFIADVKVKTREAAVPLRIGTWAAIPSAKKCPACDCCGMGAAGRSGIVEASR